MNQSDSFSHILRQPADDEAGPLPDNPFEEMLSPAAVPASRTLPRVPGLFELQMRVRSPVGPDQNGCEALHRTEQWQVAETVFTVCDMWRDHPCKMAAHRLNHLVPKINVVLHKARNSGAFVIHAPSTAMEYYSDFPGRIRLRSATVKEPPVRIKSRWRPDLVREPVMPVDDLTAKGPVPTPRACDDPTPEPNINFDRRQHSAIEIVGYDGVSDDGREIYNYMQQEGLHNIVFVGVHANMCILGRSFGIRQQLLLGTPIVLCRDLTDALYDPRDYPFVSHSRGTEMVIEHIETYHCPTIMSDDLCCVVAGSDEVKQPAKSE